MNTKEKNQVDLALYDRPCYGNQTLRPGEVGLSSSEDDWTLIALLTWWLTATENVRLEELSSNSVVAY